MAKPEAGKIVELKTKEDFDAFLKEAGTTLVIVDFYAAWCGPCKVIGPKVEAMAVEFKGKAFFAKVNVDENSETSESEGISAMPTFILYKDARKVDELTGANEAKLKEKIVSNI